MKATPDGLVEAGPGSGANAATPEPVKEPMRERANARLAMVARSGLWRIAGAFTATLMTAVTTYGGLFLYAREVQIALVGGVCAGLIAPSRRSSAAVAALACFAGSAVAPVGMWEVAATSSARLTAAGVTGLLGGIVGLVAAAGVKKAPRAARPLVVGVIVLLVANMWATALHGARDDHDIWNGRRYVSLVQMLSERPAAAVNGTRDTGDQYGYLRVLYAVEQGGSFYTAWHDELGPNREAGGSAGDSVVNYNLPTRFWFWAALPGSPASIVYAYLVLASLAVLAVPFVIRGSVRAALAIPGAAALASYLFVFGSVFVILGGEIWAGLLCVFSVAAWVRSGSCERWRAWTVAAVVLGVLAPLFRESAILVPVAGLGAAVLVRGEQRRFRAAAWAMGLAVFAGLYAAHYLNVRPLLSGPSAGAVFRLSGVTTIVSALTYGTLGLGRSGRLPLLLAATGFFGMWLFRDRRTSLFARSVAGLSMLAYVFVSNGAADLQSGDPINYWGVVIVPTIYACIPLAFGVLPGMSPPRAPGLTGRAGPRAGGAAAGSSA